MHGSQPADGGFLRGIRRIDDGVFAVEKVIAVGFLMAITVLIFVDVVYRRLVSPDSKIGSAIAVLGGIEDPATRSFVDAHVAPWVGALLGLALLWFGYWTAERHAGKTILPVRHSALVLAVATGAVIGFLGWLMLQPAIASKTFYLVLYGLIATGWAVHLGIRRPPGWVRNLVLLLVVITPAFAYMALNYMPAGYAWSQELSGILLLWVGFLGASICAHEGKHLRMEAFDRIVPPPLSRWIHAAGFVVTAAFCGLMGWLGYEYVFDPEVGAYALGGVFEQTQIPDWTATAAVPVAFGLAMLRFLGGAVSAVLGGRYGFPATEESLQAAQRAAGEGGAGETDSNDSHAASDESNVDPTSEDQTRDGEDTR